MPYATHDGIRIHYEIVGHGPPLLLHHGFQTNLEKWRWLGWVEAFAEAYQLVLMDARGHGRSDKPHDVAAYAMALRAADVVAVLDELGIETVHFHGTSMGGRIGWEMVMRAPERLRSVISGDCVPPAGRKPTKAQLQAWLAKAGLLGTQAEYLAAVDRRSDGDMPAAMHAALKDNDVAALRASVMAQVAEGLDMTEVLPTIALPCLLYGGTADPIFAGAYEAAARIPGAMVMAFSGATHGRSPQDMVRPCVRAFLERVEAGR